MRKTLALGASLALVAGTSIVGGIVLATSASAATPGSACIVTLAEWPHIHVDGTVTPDGANCTLFPTNLDGYPAPQWVLNTTGGVTPCNHQVATALYVNIGWTDCLN
ncbi:MAG: hypothetical protein FWF90_12960 [Promicromonosporaceae bacterium]|nr:hypothetical protein [Promicromonosporaceae bacterium]